MMGWRIGQMVAVGLVVSMLGWQTTGWASGKDKQKCEHDDVECLVECPEFPAHPKVWVQDFWPDCQSPEQCDDRAWCRQLQTCLPPPPELDGEAVCQVIEDCAPSCECSCERCPEPECPDCGPGHGTHGKCPSSVACNCPSLDEITASCTAACTQECPAACPALDCVGQLDQDGDGQLDLNVKAWVVDFAQSALRQLFGHKYQRCVDRGGRFVLTTHKNAYGSITLVTKCKKPKS